MPISPDFPKDPYVVLPPEIRWYPGPEALTSEAASATRGVLEEARKVVARAKAARFHGSYFGGADELAALGTALDDYEEAFGVH